jgi:hypothetical protein
MAACPWLLAYGTGVSSAADLDAIHLASAQQLEDSLHRLVTYDDRMLASARALGLPTARPA